LALASGAGAQQKIPVSIRGQAQDVYLYPALGNQARGKVLFAPGDGGWRGFAVTIAEGLASFGYEVYGLDTKRYLESFTSVKSSLRDSEVMADMRSVAESIRKRPDERPIFIGWSEGAGLGVVAGAAVENKRTFRGLVTIGLADYAVLGWRWQDNVTYVTKKRPDEPAVSTWAYLGRITPLPFLMIHSAGDEYTGVPLAQKLFQSAQEPKRFSLVDAHDHKFDGNQADFFRALRDGMDWINRASP
jgi:dienelactone hydrolase